MARSQKKKESKRKSAARPLVLDFQVRHRLAEAAEFIEQEDFVAARRVLAELRDAVPNNFAVLELLAEVCFELNDWHAYLETAERLRQRTPSRADLYLPLTLGCVRAGLPFLAARTLKEFCDRFPQDKQLAAAQADRLRLGRLCGDLLSDLGSQSGFVLKGETAARFLQDHEWMQILMSAGRFSEALSLGRTLEKAAPDWPPLCNNLSLLLGTLDKNEEAQSYVERALVAQPDNAFALAEKIRRLYLLGQTEDVHEAVEQAVLKTQGSSRDDAEVKLAEVLALLGDDRGILDAFQSAQAKQRPIDPASRAFLLCLAGTAELRMGSESEARKLWKQAKAELPPYVRPQQYLDDLDQPIGERHVPWYVSADDLMPSEWRDEYIAETRHLKSEDALRAKTRRFLSERPSLQVSLPVLLDRGDSQGRIFALALCRLASTSESLAILRDFALGQRGPDALRYEAMMTVNAAGLLKESTIRLWINGKWTEVVPVMFEVTREPLRPRTPALHAQTLTAANQELLYGRPKQALELLVPILRHKQLHISEFVALCDIEARALLAIGDSTGARKWFAMLCEESPAHPGVSKLREMLQSAEERNKQPDGAQFAK